MRTSSKANTLLNGQNPKDRLHVKDLDDNESWTTTLGEFVQDNEDDEDIIKEVLALGKGQKTRAGGGAGGLMEIKRLDKKASFKQTKAKTARYEEGVPADPTENMSEEDAAEWRENTEEYGDKFKEAGETTILADHNLVLEGSPESRAYMAKMLPIALDWARVQRVASFDVRVAKGDFCKDYKEFCRGNLGLSRTKMPQLREDVAEKFARSLAKLGIRVKKTRIPVDNLKATQKEINSDKAEGIAEATISGKFDPTKDPVLVSREGHILDGHHRWAAALVATLKDGLKRAMNVIQIDLPIRELLQRAVNFDGVAFAGFDEGNHKKASSDITSSTEIIHLMDKARDDWFRAAFQQIASFLSRTTETTWDAQSDSAASGWIGSVGGRVVVSYSTSMDEVQVAMIVGAKRLTANTHRFRDVKRVPLKTFVGRSLEAVTEVLQGGSKQARYEEGVPADPTKQMSPEDAAEWEDNTEKYRDKFKDADEFEANYFSRSAGAPDPEVVEDAFNRLEWALRRYKKLPAEDGSYHPASKDDFMFMGADRTFYMFKSYKTRNYLYVRIRDNALIIPSDDKPFFRGVYASEATYDGWLDAERIASMPDGTVGSWVTILKALYTQWDQRLSKKDRNIYRLGLLLEAAGRVEADVQKYLLRDDDEALNALEKSVKRRFTDESPRKKFYKMLGEFRSTRKPPKYPVSKA